MFSQYIFNIDSSTSFRAFQVHSIQKGPYWINSFQSKHFIHVYAMISRANNKQCRLPLETR